MSTRNPIGTYGSQSPNEGQPWQAYGGGALALTGLIGGAGSLRERPVDAYDPSATALSRYRELTDPTSNYHQRLQALYGKYFAEGAPTINSMLGVAQAAGVDPGSGAALAYQKSRQISSQNNEQVMNSLQQEMLRSETTAQGYLGLHYSMLKQQSDQRFQEQQRSESEGGSFFNQILGLGGGLLAKALI